MNQKLLTGSKGEKLAENYLLEKGYRIIEKNWRTGRLEVDIIAEYKDIIVFVEVKTRKSNSGLSEEDVLSEAKRNNLIEAAEIYLEEKSMENELRFDLVFISLQEDSYIINHIENAFSCDNF